MPPAAPPEHISVKIKVPPGSLPPSPHDTAQDSFDLGSYPVSTTVGNLRSQIQSNIPSNPTPEQQRLLYGGRALVDNTQTLADAFNTKRDPAQTEYVLHLLVKADGMNSTPHAHLHGQHRPIGGGNSSSTPPSNSAGHQHPPPASGGGDANNQAALDEATQRLREANERAAAMLHPHLRQQLNGAGGAMPPFGLPLQPTNGNVPPSSQRASQPQAPQAQNSQTNLETPQQPGHGRPIGGQGYHVQGVRPNGTRFEIHQQTINIPNMHHGQHGFSQMGMPPFPFPGMQPGMPPQMPGLPPFAMPPPNVPGMPQQFPGMPPQMPGMHPQFAAMQPPQFAPAMPGLAPPQGPPSGVPRAGRTALEQRREDMNEMRTLLEELRNSAGAQSEEDRQRINNLEQRVQRVASYIDPFGLGGRSAAGSGSSGRRSAPPNTNAATSTSAQPRESNQTQVTAHLLSGPNGPHAILFSHQHGFYNGSFPRAQQPTPTPTANPDQQPNPQQPQNIPPLLPDEGVPLPNLVQVAGEPGAQPLPAQRALQLQQAQPLPGPGQVNPNQQDMGPLQNLAAHAWLLLRVLVFGYFFMGNNMGYWRPMVLATVIAIFWAMRMGVFGDGAAVRRWWEGVIGQPQRPPQDENQQREVAAAAARDTNAAGAGEGADGQAPQPPRRAGAMPTPEQAAQRLLAEQEARQRERWGWLRERVRPVERAAALFVASLWPGIGEAQVGEQRRAREEAEAEEGREREAAEAAEAAGRDGAQAQRGQEGQQQPAQNGAAEGGVAGQEGERDRAVAQPAPF